MTVTYRTRPGLDPSQRICAMPGVRGMPSGYGPTREAAKRDMARRAHSMMVARAHGKMPESTQGERCAARWYDCSRTGALKAHREKNGNAV